MREERLGVPQREPWGTLPAREPVSASAYRLIRDAILHGRLAPGTRINEVELAQAWSISRTPVRDALRRLEAEGLVEAVLGRGMVVPSLGRADVDELYELREVLEGLAARRAAERATSEFAARLNTYLKAYGTALKQGDVDRLLAVDDDFHTSVAGMSGNGRLERAIDTIRVQIHPIRLRVIGVKGRPAKSFREMAKLTAAIRARAAVRAEAAMREHIGSLRLDAGAVLQELDAVLP